MHTVDISFFYNTFPLILYRYMCMNVQIYIFLETVQIFTPDSKSERGIMGTKQAEKMNTGTI